MHIRMSWVQVPALFHFPWKKMFGLVVLPCFDLCRCNSFHVHIQLGVGRHWWYNYHGPLLNVAFEFACLSD